MRIVPSDVGSVRGLLELHYAGGAPARVARVLAAEIDGELAGALAVSYPTLNASWRESAWPGRFGGPDKREAAHRLNREVRRISRVVVLPRHRGRGIATALVRAYLRSALTARTEAVAAFGSTSACFQRAGMRCVARVRSARDGDLLRVLRERGIDPATLVDERVVDRLPREAGTALVTWAKRARATRRLARPECLRELGALAARSLAARSGVFVSG